MNFASLPWIIMILLMFLGIMFTKCSVFCKETPMLLQSFAVFLLVILCSIKYNFAINSPNEHFCPLGRHYFSTPKVLSKPWFVGWIKKLTRLLSIEINFYLNYDYCETNFSGLGWMNHNYVSYGPNQFYHVLINRNSPASKSESFILGRREDA